MLCNSNINFSPDSIEEEPEIWEHENHGHTKTRKKKAKKKSVVIPFDTILVASHLGDSEGLDLLSWAINVAARPGDSVILSHFNTKCMSILHFLWVFMQLNVTSLMGLFAFYCLCIHPFMILTEFVNTSSYVFVYLHMHPLVTLSWVSIPSF